MGIKLGVVLPQVETSGDIDAIDEYVAAVEGMGYDHLLAYDHVIGADLASRPGWQGAYSVKDAFHEPLTLFAYLAGKTSLGLMSSVLILPQRQTVLVAKQAAEVDLLSRGRLRLGVGIGWNTVEYDALDADFSTRGRRMDEQIVLMRRLWTEPVVHSVVSTEAVRDAGILPLPVQRPIPIWLAAGLSRRGLERVGRLGDGFIPRWLVSRKQQGVGPRGLVVDMPTAVESMQIVRDAAIAAGRIPENVGLQARMVFAGQTEDSVATFVSDMLEIGMTHLAVDTMYADLDFPRGHIDALRAMMPVLRSCAGDHA